jgi:hypothetical protein
MTVQGLNNFTQNTMRRSSTWIVISLLTVIFLSIFLIQNKNLLVIPQLNFWFGILFIMSSLTAGIGLLSPLPWLYSGDEQLRAGILRGTVQSIVFNCLWLILAYSVSFVILSDGSEGVPAHFLGGEMDQHFNYWDWVKRAPANTVISTIIGALLANGGVDKLEKETMAGALNQTRLHGLQAQLSPHVLHNSLNGLAELVHQNPIKAEKGILDLSMLYRQFLTFSSKQKSTLGEEKAFIEQWLALELLRLESRLHVEWQWDDSLNSILIHPIILQPLVENALKHGVTPSINLSIVRIQSSRLPDGRLSLSVENSGIPLPPNPVWGLGLTNLDSRLKIAYGGKASFQLLARDGWTYAQIIIPDHYSGWSL